ncbi:MAG: phosphoglycerate dehydrogenase [Planctomycetota bacterium]|nr:phosphoglycerate dehydrogenase [Planctomycetota bacterium]
MIPPRADTEVAPETLRVLICDDLSPEAARVFAEYGIKPEICTGLSEDELVAKVAGVHALIVRSATKITRRVIAAADSLAVVGRAGVGVDNVDCVAATEHGVVVMNTPTGNTTTTAELAIALMVSLARHIPRADRETRAGIWKKKALTGTQLTGKQLGVIGLGRIGRVVAARGVGLGMQVVAHDPYLAGAETSPVEGTTLASLDDLLATSDFVTLHVPILDSTRNLISAERIAAMKPGARLINAARGGLVDEAAVAAALESGHLAGAAFDVLAEEPPPAGHPLVGRDDVILTPHIGASSNEAQLNVAIDIAHQVARLLLEGRADNAVNAPAVSASDLAFLAPYLNLAERMGRYLAQRLDGPVRKLEATWEGELSERDTRPLALALLSGVLGHGTDRGVNFVNAPAIAEERGLRLLEGREADAGAFQNLIKVRASTQGGGDSHLVAGTVFGRRPRFVRIDDLHVDLAPEGHMLVTDHDDVPGVVGRLGTLLGQSGLNIRRIELGKPSRSGGDPGACAQGFLQIDAQPSEAFLASVRDLDFIREARIVHLGPSIEPAGSAS